MRKSRILAMVSRHQNRRTAPIFVIRHGQAAAELERQACKVFRRARTVIDGPFAETKELIAGYWMWQVRSIDEAVEWLKRAPFDGGTEVEIRPVFEAADFGEDLTPELREREERLREQIAAKK